MNPPGALIVSDTSPLNYLVLIGHETVLRKMFEQVCIPPSVLAELQHAQTPHDVRAFVTRPPSWLTVASPTNMDNTLPVELGRGEREAISLAMERRAHAVLMDEKLGRTLASERGLRVRGTLGIIDEADARGLLRAKDAVESLRSLGFRSDASLYAEILRRSAARGEGRP